MPIRNFFISDDTENFEVELRKVAIQKASEKTGLEEALLVALVEHESGNNPYARRNDFRPLSKQKWVEEAIKKYNLSGNYWYFSAGYTQMLYLVAKAQYGFNGTFYELFDPIENIDLGARHLAWNIKRYGGNIRKGLSAYNAGSYTENNTKDYVDKVMKLYEKYKVLK
jgi:soluble lytic murein transglycosylase-like protein